MTTKELRPRSRDDFYPTPVELCRAALSLVSQTKEQRKYLTITQNFTYRTILDPGCGIGVWGKAASELWPNAYLEGVDIRGVLDEEAQNTYDNFVFCDFKIYPGWLGSYELIMGNPPFSLAEDFVRKGWELLAERGVMLYLLRLAFLEGQDRAENLWKELPPSSVQVLGRRPSFTGDRKTDATAYAIFIWSKGLSLSLSPLDWLRWNYEN